MGRINGYYWVKVATAADQQGPWQIAFWYDGFWIINGHRHAPDYAATIHPDRIEQPKY